MGSLLAQTFSPSQLTDRSPNLATSMVQSTNAPTQPETPPTPQSARPSRLACVREGLESQGISKGATEIILKSWTLGTQKQYKKPWQEWISWCDQFKTDQFQAPVTLFIDFLLNVYDQGRTYSTVNTYRSAIATTIHAVTGRDLGSNHLVSRFMKGIYVSKPPLPRYSSTWDVSKVTDYMKTLTPLENLSLKELSLKLATLTALSTAQRGQTLQALSIDQMKIEPNQVVFNVTSRLKTSRPGNNSLQVILPKLSNHDKPICPYCHCCEPPGEQRH